jgi:hypothetical protein
MSSIGMCVGLEAAGSVLGGEALELVVWDLFHARHFYGVAGARILARLSL